MLIYDTGSLSAFELGRSSHIAGIYCSLLLDYRGPVIPGVWKCVCHPVLSFFIWTSVGTCTWVWGSVCLSTFSIVSCFALPPPLNWILRAQLWNNQALVSKQWCYPSGTTRWPPSPPWGCSSSVWRFFHLSHRPKMSVSDKGKPGLCSLVLAIQLHCLKYAMEINYSLG